MNYSKGDTFSDSIGIFKIVDIHSNKIHIHDHEDYIVKYEDTKKPKIGKTEEELENATKLN